MPKAKTSEVGVKRLSFLRVVLLLLCLGLISYTNAIFHPFVHDDVVFIQNNPHLGAWNDFFAIFLNSSTDHPSTPFINNYYRPLLEILYKIQYFFFSLDPHKYHLFNILLHIVNSVLVYLLMTALPRSDGFSIPQRTAALLVAIFFLIHPIQTEAVSCIAGVSNLIFSFFCLLSFIFYLWKETPRLSRHSSTGHCISLFFFGMALLAKEQAIMFPLLIIWYEICFHGQTTHPLFLKRENIVRIISVVGVALVYLAWRQIVTGNSLSQILNFKTELILRLLQIPRVLLTFGGILIFPWELHYYRSVDILQPFIFPTLILVLFLAGTVFFISKTPKHYKRWMIFALGWFFLSLLPSLNIVPLINEYSLILTAEHFLYFPVIGFILFMILLGSYVLENVFLKRRAVNPDGPQKLKVFLLVSFLGIFCVIMTIKQNRYWRDEISLFQRVVKFEYNFGRGHFLLAKAYYFHEKYPQAVIEYRITLDIMKKYLQKINSLDVKRNYLGFMKESYFDLAHCYEFQGNVPGAVREYESALGIDPRDPVLHNNVGLDYVYLNDFPLGMNHFQKAIALNPKELQARNNLAICQIRLGNLREAENTLEEIIKIDPSFQTAQQNLRKLKNQ